MANLLRFDGADDYIAIPNAINVSGDGVLAKIDFIYKGASNDVICGGESFSDYWRINNDNQFRVAISGNSSNLSLLSPLVTGERYKLVLFRQGLSVKVVDENGNDISSSGNFTTSDFVIGTIGSFHNGSSNLAMDLFCFEAGASHVYDPSKSIDQGVLFDELGSNHGTPFNFPANFNDALIYYDDGSDPQPEPVAQPVSLITAEIKNEALTLPISEALAVNLLTGEHVTNSYVLNLVSSQVGNATISEERHQASMLTVEQTASQSVISIAAEHRPEAQILTPIQHQRLNSIVAQQVEQALSASLSSIQALTFVVAEEIQNAAPLTVEQYTGQLITLIVAEQREGTQTLLVSEVNKLDLVTAEQASDAQALSIKDLQKIKTIEVEQLTEAEILHVLLSGDNTDLTGLRLQPVTSIYSITPIANSYSLNKV